MSRMSNTENRCIFVYGKESSADRTRLLQEFSEFGKVTKIFVENAGKYSKVYFENSETCEEAADVFKVNHLGWIVEYPKTPADGRNLELRLRNNHLLSGSSVISCDQDLNKEKRAMDFGDEAEFTQNYEYCTLHGDPVVVLVDDSGEKYVNYNDVKKAGFALFRRDNFHTSLMDRKQSSKEFELFLLAEARNYILKRRLNFNEEEILSTIERCREKVLAGQSNTQPSSSNARRSVNAAGPHLTVTPGGWTNGTTSGLTESREAFQRPRPPHKNFQRNNSGTNERSDRNYQSAGADKRDFGRGRNDRSQSRGRQSGNESSENINNFGKNLLNDNDFGRNRSNAQEFGRSKPSDQDFGMNRSNDQEFGRAKPIDKNFGRNKQAGGGFRKNTAVEDTSFQNNGNNQDSPNNRGTQPRKYAKPNAASSADECSSVRSDKYAKKHEKEEIESVTLQPGNTYDLIVSYVDNEKVQWVQTEEYHEKITDMTVDLLDVVPSLEDIVNPTSGQLVLALYEEVWYRARVIKQDPLLVHYLDYGNRNSSSAVKVLPEEYRKIPAAAMRTTGLQNLNMTLQVNQKVRLHVKQQYDDGTYLVKLDNAGNTCSRTQEQTRGSTSGTKSQETHDAAATHSIPQEHPRESTPNVKSMERRPTSRTEVVEDIYTATDVRPLFKLKNDEPVKIIGRRDCQLLVKNKECYDKAKELNEYIKKLDTSRLTFGSVKAGQLVLAKKDDDAVDIAIWQRATVVSKESAATIQISYVDFPGEDSFGIKSLRNVDEHLANYPALMTVTPTLSALEGGVTSALEYIDQLIQEKAKLRLVMVGNDVDFKFEDGTLLSKMIFKLNKGSSMELPKLVPVMEKDAQPQPAETEKPSTSTANPSTEPSPPPKPLQEQKAELTGPFLFDCLDWTRLDIGTHDVIVYAIKTLDDITVVSTNDKLIDQLAQVTAIQVKDDTPYEPIECEMCLVAYKSESEEEASWFRAYIASIEGDKYTATCVDYGNDVIVTKNEIRKFPLDLKDIPMMGINCECVGIPYNDTVLKKIKELLPEDEQCEIKVIECVESLMKYKIEIPRVYEELKRQGVI